MDAIVSIAITLVIAIIGFFLKRTINSVDTKADKTEVQAMDEEHRQKMSAMASDIERIKTNYLTKEDFFREQAKTDRKLDKIYDILLEIKGGNKNG